MIYRLAVIADQPQKWTVKSLSLTACCAGTSWRLYLFQVGAVPEINRSAIVPFSAAQMYALVRNVDNYPQFLDWVRSAEVHEQDERYQRATLEVKLAGLTQRFTTVNRLVPDKKLVMNLERGAFEHLSGRWEFDELGSGCRVSLSLEFEIGGLLLRPFRRNFSRMADRMVDDFVRRAEQVHGR